MKRFPTAHATHPQWRMAVALVLAQLRAQMALPGYAAAPTLGLLYITDHDAAEAAALLDVLSAELPEVIGLCHRVYVMADGRIAGEVAGDDLSEERIMSLAIPKRSIQ